jgi:hypothetical protein
MAKTSGLGSAFLVGSVDLSGDIGALTGIPLSRNLQDVSSIQSDGTERIGLRSDGSMSYMAFWNASAGQSVATLGDLPTAQTLCTYIAGSGLGAYAASLTTLAADITATMGEDGSLGMTGTANAAAGTKLEWGQVLTIGKQTYASTQAISAWVVNTVYALNALVVPTVANGHYYKATTGGTSHAATEPTWPTNGTTVADNTVVWTDQGLLPNGVDGGASTSFGLAGYLHAFSIGSGSATVTIQDSANRIDWTNVTGGGFTAVTGATTQRIQTATNGTVRRYVRVHVTGTFTNLVLAVNFVRYLNQQA